jgi:hypothetical protein
MLNNNQYYNGYNPYQQQQMNNFIKPITNMEWVNGDIGASAYLVQGYNSAVALFDSETNDTMYIKSTDNTGRPSLKKYKIIEEIESTSSSPDLSEYVKKTELQDLLSNILKEGVKHESTIPTTQQQPIIKKTITATTTASDAKS